MRKFILFYLVLFLNISLFGQVLNDNDAMSVLERRGEVYIQFDANPDEISDFVKIMSVDSYNGETVLAYANRKQFEKFLLSGKKYSLVESYYDRSKALNMASTVAEMLDWDRYPTYEVYVEMMQMFAFDYPEICSLDTIGYSGDGRLILVVKISDNVTVNEAEPEFLYTGQMHGDELIGGMLFLRLIAELLDNYGTDPQITNLVDGIQIYINPFANPDGTYYGGNSSIADSRRNNSQDIDLNRNFHDFSAGAHPDDNEYAIETQLFMDYATSRNFVMSGNSHAGAELLNYPYDTEPILPADNDWWVLVCREYADTVHEVSSSYLTDEDNGVTNGYAWYQAIGTRQDYMNYYHNCKEVTMELSSVKLVDSELLPDYWGYNRNALLNYLQQVSYGLRGIVTDSITHEPLEAMVFIDGYDFLNSHVYSFPEHGDYYRLLKAGNYSVTFSAAGYKSKTIDVSITDYATEIVDVELANLEAIAPTADFVSSTLSTSCNPEIVFINTSEASISTTYNWDFGDGTFSVEENPSHFYGENGLYTVKLFAENEHGEDSVVKTEYINISLSELDGLSDYVICETSGSVLIELPQPGDYQWFFSPTDQEPFHTADNFGTPVLNENTTYYVQEVYTGAEFSGGELNNSQGGEYVTGDNYLLFNCMQECVLQSVKVYADGPGIRTIYLKNSLGDILYSEDFEIADGLQTVNLNYNLPIENGLKLGCSASLALYRGATGIFSSFDYPFNVGTAVSITQSNVVWWNDGNRYYAYFYDWQIKMPDCYSERTPLTVYVNQNPEADFSYAIDGGGLASFTNLSTAADSYLWDFGDESSSTDANPVHQYAVDGNYTVKLTATSACGSHEFSTQVVVTTGINSCGIRELSIYPNPALNMVSVLSDKEIQGIRLLDLSGKIIIEISEVSAFVQEINVSKLTSGIYMLELTYSDNTKTVTKLTKN